MRAKTPRAQWAVPAAWAVAFGAGAAAMARRLRTDNPDVVVLRERLLRVAAEFDRLLPLVEPVACARHPQKAKDQMKRLQVEVAALLMILADDDYGDPAFGWPAMLADAFGSAGSVVKLRGG